MTEEEEEFNNHLEQQKQHEWQYWDRDLAWVKEKLKNMDEHNPMKTG